MKLDIFTLFPEAFDWFQSQRSVQNALTEGNELRLFNYRDTTPLGAGQVDDAPYGGGAGMVLRVDVVDAALQAAYPNGERPRRVLLSPTGRLLDDELADELTRESHVAVLCGRYEGFDERVHEHFADDEVSIGRYVLAGGELPAMVLADVVMRKLPGALGHEHSAVEESFSQQLEGMPEYPHYTRPASYRGWQVPDVLVSGDHERVRLWRLEQSRARAEQFEKNPE
ncbi:MAG: tRNA (guanine37-N1)-methyltransferase [Solirubrobacterales bacterium]|jgi:tRNA (guanine37-N1)-methyltransferase|nr:tRNA (guanine37-N1)-methyltransferase [Solirubrobacterales bacterium]